MSDALAQLSAEENRKTIAVVGGVTAVAGLAWWLKKSSNSYKKKPGTFEIGSGGVDRTKVKDEVRHLVIYPSGPSISSMVLRFENICLC